jgi:N-acetylglucosaminyl-diphospho-decaprenol L-rhamnosyltransferase
MLTARRSGFCNVMPDVDIVIVSWNSARVLPECLRSIRRAREETGVGGRTIVVDNASTDGSVAIARSADAVLIENPVNAGFAVGANQGVALVTSEWFALVNPDLVIASSFLTALAAHAASAPPSVAAIAPDVRFRAAPDIVNTRGIGVDAAGAPYEIQAGLHAASAGAVPPPFGVSGGAGLLRTSAFREVGGFEPAFFAYLEDVDLAWRLQRTGFRATYEGDASALHEGSAGTGEGSPVKLWLVARNRRLVFRRHGPAGRRAVLLRLLVDGGHLAFSVLANRSLEPVRGRAAAAKARSYVSLLRQRDAQRLRSADSVTLDHSPSLLRALRRKLATQPLMRNAP